MRKKINHILSYKDIIGWLFIGMALVLLANSLRLCFSNDIWYDELFTMGMAQHSYRELIQFTARDVHPPLYYFIVKFAIELCKPICEAVLPLFGVAADGQELSIVLAKIVSVIPYFLMLIYALTFMRKKFGIFVSGLFLFCILGMPQMSAYTVEIRMYSWALFFVTAAFLHAYGIVNSQRKKNTHFIALLFYGLAAAYTQYFACVAVVMVYLYVLVFLFWEYRAQKTGRKDENKDENREEKNKDGNKEENKDGIMKKAIRNWFLCVAASIVGYLPWLFVLISQITTVRENYWILPLTWRSLGGCVKFLMKPAFASEGLNVLFAVVFFLLYVAVFGVLAFRLLQERKSYKSKEKREVQAEACLFDNLAPIFSYAAAGCMVLVGLVAFGFLASILIRPIFVYRYMLPAMGCFWLGFVLCVDALFGVERGNSGEQKYRADEQKCSVGEKTCCVGEQAGRGQKIFRQIAQAGIVLLLAVVGLRNYRAFMGEEEYKAVLMKETNRALAQIQPEDITIYNFDQLQAVAGCYVNHENYLWCDTPETLIVDMFGEKGSIEDTEPIQQWLEEGRKVWFLGSFNSREEICADWEEEGILTTEEGSFLLERYWFNLYEVSQ